MRFYYNTSAELDRLFDDVFTPHLYIIPSTSCASRRIAQPLDPFRPRMDLHESKDPNTMTATFELPGLKSEDVAIDVLQNRLTVSGEFGTAPSEGEGGFAIHERRHGRFSRTLQLPFGTNPEDVSAKMENGVLTVTFPRTTHEQQAKCIPIQ